MFKFFSQKQWFPWSIFGSLFILVSTWYQVQLDVKINEWFGDFYDTLQKALTTPNSVSEAEFIGYLFTFAKIAGLWIVIAVFTGFLQVIGFLDGEHQWQIITMSNGLKLD